MIETNTLIIGAGLSGLILSKELHHSTIILEKSRGIGGRIANRRIQELGFDHGAPYFPNDPIVHEILKNCNLINITHTSAHGLYLDGSMTTLAKSLSQGLEIHKSKRARFIKPNGVKWLIETEDGEQYLSSFLVITAPLTQAIELLDLNSISYTSELKSISYTSALMALIITSDEVIPDKHFPERVDYCLSMKQRKLHPRGFVIKWKASVSEEIFNQSDEYLLSKIMEDFSQGFSVSPKIEHFELKKWKYAQPKSALHVPFMELEKNLFLIGDAFSYPDLRGSIIGAKVLAKKLNYTHPT